jgi:sulfiredoxin
MATTDTAVQSKARTIAIDRLHVPNNVRALDQAHVDALAGSIALQGQIVPVIVRSDGENYVLVAGFHRYAAARQLGLQEITYELRDGETEDADRAVENIARKQLNPHEPGTIALDATFGGRVIVLAAGSRDGSDPRAAFDRSSDWPATAGFRADRPDQMQHCCGEFDGCLRSWLGVLTSPARRTWCWRRTSRSWIRRGRCSMGCCAGGSRSSTAGC